MVAVISWCVHMRGPLFASVFTPLMLLMATLAGCTMLNEKLHLGRYICLPFAFINLLIILRINVFEILSFFKIKMNSFYVF